MPGHPDTLPGILAQRLARRPCTRCSTPCHPSEEEFTELVRDYDPLLFEEHQMTPWSPGATLMRKGDANGATRRAIGVASPA